MGNSPAVLSFDRLCLKLNRFIYNELLVLADHREEPVEEFEKGSIKTSGKLPIVLEECIDYSLKLIRKNQQQMQHQGFTQTTKISLSFPASQVPCN
jgi:hypothetical protein